MPSSGSNSNSAGSLSFLAPEKVDGILALIGGFCLHLTLGTLYCFGNLNTYMTSYLRENVHPGIEYSDMIWVPCLATVSQGLFMTYSGHLEEIIGIRWTIISGATIMSAGVMLTSISIQVTQFDEKTSRVKKRCNFTNFFVYQISTSVSVERLESHLKKRCNFTIFLFTK